MSAQIMDPNNHYRWVEVRGQVVEIVDGEAAVDHIHHLSHLYRGRPYNNFRPGEERVIYKIEPTHVTYRSG